MKHLPGSSVKHEVYGPGRMLSVVGGQAVVEFFGESIDVPFNELTLDDVPPTIPSPTSIPRRNLLFRRAYEAINLGVVPPNPDALISLTIGGDATERQLRDWLSSAPTRGFCKVVFGEYGSGKSHYLKLVQAIGLKQGWVVPFVEFDPKQADPAKPHLVYRALLSGLRFPKRDDGSQCRGFFDLVGEIRKFWARVSQGTYFKMSPWFRITLEALRRHPHCEEQEYLDVCGWLAGEPINYATVKTFCRLRGGAFPPSMPRVRESAEIYVFHLVVLHEICQALGYRGLLLVLDEAEHVRGYNVSRHERASNFFDFLARSSHPPLKGVSAPLSNDHGHQLPPYWNRGPLFGTVVGLTEGDTFTDKSLSLRDACVFLHDETDAVMLQCPNAAQYKNWCLEFLRTVHDHLPESTQLLANEDDRAKLAQVLAEEFQQQRASERTLRLWVKLASLVPSVTMSHNANTISELANIVRSAARTASGQLLPWEV